MTFQLLPLFIAFIFISISAGTAVPKTTLQKSSRYECVTSPTRKPKTLFDVLKNSKRSFPSFDRNNNDYDIFARLIADASLRHTLFASPKLTVFVPRDLAMKQTAFDILDYQGKPSPRLWQMTEFRTYKIISDFIKSYKNPDQVRKTIVKIHVIRGELSLCDLIENYVVTTVAQQKIKRSGLTLRTENKEFPYSFLYLSPKSFDVKTRNGYIHNVDRMLMPNLSSFERRMKN